MCDNYLSVEKILVVRPKDQRQYVEKLADFVSTLDE